MILQIIKEASQQIISHLEVFWEVFRNWYWIFLPYIFWKPATNGWLFWRSEIYESSKGQQNILYEIIIPKESVKPIRAMESVFTSLWQIHSTPNWHEKWWKGQDLPSYSFEIAGIDGIPHFYIRCRAGIKNVVHSAVHSQYPEAEIIEVEDYTQKVPQDAPNKDWTLWGCDYRLVRPECYPIKTYENFETEREIKEEKRIDPMAALLESIGRLKEGEQIWIQIRTRPILEENKPWKAEGKKIIDKLVYRKPPPPKKTLVGEFASTIGEVAGGILGVPQKKSEKPRNELLPPEMKLTPGEREVVAGIENKISKLGYETYVRFIYLGKKGSYMGGNKVLGLNYFTNFVTQNLNALVPWSPSITKIKKNWWDWYLPQSRRLYLRKRKTFRNYVMRVPYPFPQKGGTFVLNTEELASIYHFPSRILTPSSLVPRIESKKGEAPLELPIE